MNNERIALGVAIAVAALVGPGGTAPARAAEPLPPGHGIYAAYEQGKPEEAQELLRRHIREHCEAALRPIPADAAGAEIEERLGIGITANVAAHALTLHAKHAAGVPVGGATVRELRRLLGAIDRVIADAAARAKDDERLRKVSDYAAAQKEILLPRALDVMKAQTMHEELKTALAENREFMERRKIDSSRWAQP